MSNPMTKPKKIKAVKLSPRAWLYAGGGGLEIKKGDEDCWAVTFYGMVDILESYQQYLITPITKKARRK